MSRQATTSTESSYGIAHPPKARALGAAATLPTKTGNADVRERSAFRGATWKPRRLELDEEVLCIVNPTSSKRTRVPLSCILAIERTELAPYALGIRLRGGLSSSLSNKSPATSVAPPPSNSKKLTTLSLAFATDAALYDWQDELYARSPLGRYTSGPIDFVHKAHIGGDGVGNFGDANILPIYAEIIGGGAGMGLGATLGLASSGDGTNLKPRSRPVSGVVLTKGNSNMAGSPATSPTIPGPSSGLNKTAAGATKLEARADVRQQGDGVLARWFGLSRARWVVLGEGEVVLHSAGEKSSAPARTIPLARIARATPEATRPTTLLVEVAPEKAPKSAPRAEAETLRLTFARAQDATAWGTAVAAAQARVREDERQKMLRALEREKEAVRAKQAEKAQKEDERLREEKRERRQSRRRSAQPLVQG